MTDYPEEFQHVLDVLDFGASKYSANGWLEPDGVGMDRKSQMASMARHLGQAIYSSNPYDSESGLHHALHLACRALMFYTRHVRGIKHSGDCQ